MLESVLDKRYKATIDYLNTKQGEPVFKRRALLHINNILGPELSWRYKTPEEYYGDDRIQ